MNEKEIRKKVREEYINGLIEIIKKLAKKYGVSVEEADDMIRANYREIDLVDEWEHSVEELRERLEEKYNVIIEHEEEEIYVYEL